MSNYVKLYDFAYKDTLTTGDPDKLVRGSEIDTELTAIAAAIQSKADIGGSIGTATAVTPPTANNSTRVATTAFVYAALADVTIVSGGTF